MIEKAIGIIIIAHAGQFRDDGKTPYYKHCVNVMNILKKFQFFDEKILVAALLHDIIEDTAWSYNDILKSFGEDIAIMVADCSDDTRLPSIERFEDTLNHIKYMTQNGLYIKLADILDNISDMNTWDKKRQKSYLHKKQRILDAMKNEVTIFHHNESCLFNMVQKTINEKLNENN